MRPQLSLVSGVLLITLIFPAFLDAQTSEQELIEQGTKHYGAGNYYYSSTWLERLIKTYPASAHRQAALRMLASSYSLTERDEKARHYLRILLDEHPEESRLLTADLQRLGEPERPYALSLSLPLPETPVVPVAQAGGSQQGVVTGNSAPPAAAPGTGPISPRVTISETVAAAQHIKTDTPEQETPLTAIFPGRTTPPDLPADLPAVWKVPVPTRTPANKDSQFYTVVAGQSLIRAHLKPLMKQLAAAGITATLSRMEMNWTVYRLKAGVFEHRKRAVVERDRIARTTKNAFIYRDGTAYVVAAGSLMSRDQAVREVSRLAAKGLKGLEIDAVQVMLNGWRVHTGRYSEAPDAEMSANRLLLHGIKASIERPSR